MATKKKAASDTASKKKPTGNNAHTASYEAALQNYATALDLLHKGEPAAAKDLFEKIAVEYPDEAVMADRCRSYAAVCERKLTPAEAFPESADDCYFRAVLLANGGEADEAIRLLEQALQMEPSSPRLLYARATAWALKGNTEAAVGDLRQAIAGEPQARYQAANDPDFESIREEPAFIDIIEPTPTGA